MATLLIGSRFRQLAVLIVAGSSSDANGFLASRTTRPVIRRSLRRRGEPLPATGHEADADAALAETNPFVGTTIMRVHIIVVSLTLFGIGTAAGTVVDAGADAQKYCELLAEGSFRDSAQARSAGACEGMIETAMFFARNLPPDVRACPPVQGSILESARVLVRYLENNPERLSEPGITLAFEAFRDAWPCLGDDAEPSGKPGPKKRAKKSK